MGKIYQDRAEKQAEFLVRRELAEKQLELEKIIPSHSCAAQPFRVYLPLGESANFRVELNESELGKSYRVYLGDLPYGVTASLVNYEGQEAREALVTLEAAADAQQGDFSIVINYDEQIGLGVEKNIKCQFNLIIED